MTIEQMIIEKINKNIGEGRILKEINNIENISINGDIDYSYTFGDGDSEGYAHGTIKSNEMNITKVVK